MLPELISLDTKTLLGILVWGNAAAGLIIFLYQSFNVRNVDHINIRNMTIIRLLCTAGYLLLFLRGNINNIISVNIGNTILYLSHYLEARLILELTDSSNKKLNNIITAIFVLSILTFNSLELYFKDAALRISMASIIIFFIFLLPTIKIVTSKEVSGFKKSISIFYIFLLLALIPRSLQSFFDKSNTLLYDHYSNSLMFIAFILMTLSNTVIYLLFIKEKTDILIEKNSALETLLNALNIYILVSELDTDNIIFINDKMKEKFNLGECAIGERCCDIMNPGKNERCAFCVKQKLMQKPEIAESLDSVINIGSVSYTKADRIIEWHDGRNVHLQYFLDVSELKKAETRLEVQLSQLERMSALINAAQQSISYIMPNGKFGFFNPATAKLSGYTSEELMEMDTLNFFDEETKKYITDEIIPRINTQVKCEFELPLIRKDGEVRTMKFSAFTIDDDEKGRGYITSDVTELKQLEQKLVEAKEKAELIINTAPIAYGLSVDGIVLESNEYAKEHLGMKPGDETMSFYLNPEERKALCFNSKAKADKSMEGGVLWFRMPDGGSHRFLTNYSILKLGNKEAIILMAVDIEFSELQKDQLRISQDSLQTLLDMMPVTVRVIDLDTETLIYANQAAFKMYEIESPDLVYGKRVDALMPETQPDGTSSVQRLRELNMSVEPVSKEMVFRKGNGQDFDALISVFTIDYKGVKASVGIIQDLTAEKAYANMLRNTAEKEKEANRSKSEFLSRMSHEIRTPMNAIIGMTAIAQGTREPKKIKQCLDKIDNASKHLLGVINDILDMSKIEADKLELFYEEFNFNNMLDNTFGIINFSIERKQQKLKVNVDEGVPLQIISDKQRLSQVVTNLLSNATKFTPDCGTIELNAKKIDEQDGVCTLQIEVKDSGIGIPLELQSNIFNSFEQAGGGIARKYGGTGLGLAISKRIVELMDGSIWVESESGYGSRFIFTVKAMRGSSKLTKTQLKEDAVSSNDFSNHTILIAEDIEINRDIISALLEETGIMIDEAENGLEAVKCFQNNPERYSLVLMDINMPEMDGYDATRNIRSLEYQSAKLVPIIAMTADVFNEDIERCIAAGMNDHIGKPVDINELFTKIKRYLL